MFQFTIGVVTLAFVAFANANAIGQVVDVAHQGSPVGSHGPALVNSWGHGGWNNGGWGNGGWNNGGYGYGPIGIGGHGLPSLSVNGWGAHGDAHGHDG